MPYPNYFHQFMLLYRPFTSELNKILAPFHLYSAQWSALYFIHSKETISLVEISEYLYVEKPTITRTINRLEELQYIEQIPGKDKREKRIRLTPLGEDIFYSILNKIRDYARKITENISEQEQNNAIRVMQDIRKNIIKKRIES